MHTRLITAHPESRRYTRELRSTPEPTRIAGLIVRFLRQLLSGSALMLDANHAGPFTFARPPQRMKNRIASIVGIVDDHPICVERVLQRRTHRMNRRSASLAHALRSIQREGRWRFRMAVHEIGHVHGGNRSVVAECG